VLQYALYAVADIFLQFAKSFKDISFIKDSLALVYAIKWFQHDLPLAAQLCRVCNTFRAVIGILGATQAITKLADVAHPLREKTIVVLNNTEGTFLGDDGKVQNGVQAGPVSNYEMVAKKVQQVADWITSVADLGRFCLQEKLFPSMAEWVTFKNLTVIGGTAGIVASSYALWEETVKLSTGNLVRAEPDQYNTVADGFVWRMTWEDKIHSWLKVAMYVSSVALELLTILALFPAFNITPPFIIFFLGLASSFHIASYLWERIAIDSLERAHRTYIKLF